jgi:hypothetical protein
MVQQQLFNLTPKAFANYSLGQRPRERHLEISRTLKAFDEKLALHFANTFSVLGLHHSLFPEALPQARIGERLRRNFVIDSSSI